MELKQVAKAKRPKQADIQRAAQRGASTDDVVSIIAPGHNSPVRPPRNGRRVALAAGLLAAGGGGAYLYQRNRTKRSLSQMQPGAQPMMMRST